LERQIAERVNQSNWNHQAEGRVHPVLRGKGIPHDVLSLVQRRSLRQRYGVHQVNSKNEIRLKKKTFGDFHVLKLLSLAKASVREKIQTGKNLIFYEISFSYQIINRYEFFVEHRKKLAPVVSFIFIKNPK
jgi:hypothetical protein